MMANVHYAPRRLEDDKKIKFWILLDIASVELFADDNLTVITDVFFPIEDFTKINLFTDKKTKLLNGQLIALKEGMRDKQKEYLSFCF